MKKVIISTLMFFTVATSVFSQSLDYRILCSLQQHRTPQMDNAMRWVSNSLVLAPAVAVGLTAGGWVCDDAPTLEWGKTTSISLLSATGVTMGLKYAVHRPRPYQKYTDDLVSVTTEFDPSFPSGHTTMAFSTAVSLSLCYPKWYVVAPSLLWASTVGFSRLYLGVHYPSDVLTGMIIGSAAAVITYMAREKQRDELGIPQPKGITIPIVISF